MGIETIAAALSESRDALEEVIEPYLLQQGLIQRTPRGRMLARTPGTHLGARRAARWPGRTASSRRRHMTPEEVQALFTRRGRQLRLRAMGTAVAPVVFGVEDATLGTIKGAIEAVVPCWPGTRRPRPTRSLART